VLRSPHRDVDPHGIAWGQVLRFLFSQSKFARFHAAVNIVVFLQNGIFA
jgi:hypothetical protein